MKPSDIKKPDPPKPPLTVSIGDLIRRRQQKEQPPPVQDEPPRAA